MTVLVLLGGPGSGKGTQAAVLSERLELPHIATGDLFRAAVRDGSQLGLAARRYMERGQLVPDDITIRMLGARLAHGDATRGVILDGFPRNGTQAEALDAHLAEGGGRVDRALEIDVPTEVLIARLSARWVCQAAGHPYNEQTHRPRVAGRCDLDGSPLIQRADDRAETIRARLAMQLGSLREVVSHYRAAGVLRTVDGRTSIDEVSAALLAAVADLFEAA
jgi:adenylate kinase